MPQRIDVRSLVFIVTRHADADVAVSSSGTLACVEGYVRASRRGVYVTSNQRVGTTRAGPARRSRARDRLLRTRSRGLRGRIAPALPTPAGVLGCLGIVKAAELLREHRTVKTVKQCVSPSVVPCATDGHGVRPEIRRPLESVCEPSGPERPCVTVEPREVVPDRLCRARRSVESSVEQVGRSLPA